MLSPFHWPRRIKLPCMFVIFLHCQTRFLSRKRRHHLIADGKPGNDKADFPANYEACSTQDTYGQDVWVRGPLPCHHSFCCNTKSQWNPTHGMVACDQPCYLLVSSRSKRIGPRRHTELKRRLRWCPFRGDRWAHWLPIVKLFNPCPGLRLYQQQPVAVGQTSNGWFCLQAIHWIRSWHHLCSGFFLFDCWPKPKISAYHPVVAGIPIGWNSCQVWSLLISHFLRLLSSTLPAWQH